MNCDIDVVNCRIDMVVYDIIEMIR